MFLIVGFQFRSKYKFNYLFWHVKTYLKQPELLYFYSAKLNTKYKLVCTYIGSKIILALKFVTWSIFKIHRKHEKLMATDF